jgi:hypothetical protein
MLGHAILLSFFVVHVIAFVFIWMLCQKDVGVEL